MGLIYIVVVIAILGLIVWLITTYIPMPEPFKMVIYVVCVIVLLLWLLQFLGGATVGFPRLR